MLIKADLKLNDGESKNKKLVLAAMELMAEHNYITSHEFERILGYRMKVWRYAKALEVAGYIHSFDTFPLNGDVLFQRMRYARRAYCVTIKGAGVLEEAGRLRVRHLFHPDRYQPVTLSHTSACVQTRLRFEEHPAVLNYLPERVLYASRKRGSREDIRFVPDAKFVFETRDAGKAEEWPGAVEVELTRKHRRRIMHKLSNYDQRHDLAIVVWVCVSEALRDHIRDTIEGMRLAKKGMSAFVLYRDLLENGLGRARLTDWRGRVFDCFQLESK